MTPQEAAELIDVGPFTDISEIEGKLNTLIITNDIDLNIKWLKEFIQYFALKPDGIVQVVASAIMTYNNKQKIDLERFTESNKSAWRPTNK